MLCGTTLDIKISIKLDKIIRDNDKSMVYTLLYKYLYSDIDHFITECKGGLRS